MRHLTRSIALCFALAMLAACDNLEAPLAPQPEVGAARMAVASPGPVAFYPFDQGPGNGTLVGTPILTTGYQGGAYYFNGTSAYINLPLNINPGSMPQATMGAWARVASVTPGRSSQVLSHDNGNFDRSIALDLRTHNAALGDGKHHFGAFIGTGVLPGPATVLNRWVFLAAVYDAGTVTLYVDGVRYTTPGTPGTGVSYLRVGGNPSFFEPFHGVIDNVFVYDRALSEAEIAAIRTGGACAIVTPCAGAPGNGVIREGLGRMGTLVSQARGAEELSASRSRHLSKLIAAATGYLDQAEATPRSPRQAVMLRYLLVELEEALTLLQGPGTSTAATRDETLRVRGLVQARLDTLN